MSGQYICWINTRRQGKFHYTKRIYKELNNDSDVNAKSRESFDFIYAGTKRRFALLPAIENLIRNKFMFKHGFLLEYGETILIARNLTITEINYKISCTIASNIVVLRIVSSLNANIAKVLRYELQSCQSNSWLTRHFQKNEGLLKNLLELSLASGIALIQRMVSLKDLENVYFFSFFFIDWKRKSSLAII